MIFNHKKPHTEDPMCVISNPHLSSAAGFGTLLTQVAGFHRAVPSTALDKACMQFSCLFYTFYGKSQGDKSISGIVNISVIDNRRLSC